MKWMAGSPVAIWASALTLGACGPAPGNNVSSLADAAEGSERISNRHFGRATVPCREPEPMARALLELTRRDLADGVNTRLLDFAEDDVPLKDAAGKIVVIVYAISIDQDDGADDAVITTTEHFLINSSCQVLHWSSAVQPYG